MEKAAAFGPHRVLLMPDHYTPISTKTHGIQPVPFVIWDSENRLKGGAGFNEPAAKASGLFVDRAHELIERLVREK